MNSLTQPVRLGVLVVYLIGLLVVSRVVLGDWVPPANSSGLWFYGGLMALLVGDLIVSPFFTKPADALSYSITGLVALFVADVAFNGSREEFEQTLWIAGIAIVGIVLVASLVSIGLRTASSPFGAWLASNSFKVADTYGGPRRIYFLIFLLATLVFHRESTSDFAVLLSTGLLVTFVRPVEGAWIGVRAVTSGWDYALKRSPVGELFARQEPGIMLVKVTRGATVGPGDLVLARTHDGVVHVGLHLDLLWLAGETWARIVRLRITQLTQSEEKDLVEQAGPPGTVTKLQPLPNCKEALDKIQRIRIVSKNKKLVGIVAPDTNLRTLYFEVTGIDTEIEEGQLVETRIGSQIVLYQVIDGVSREEILRERNSYGYARGKARKIGVWDEDARRFVNVRWIPLVNEPIIQVDEERPKPESDVIGYFPKTRYPVIVRLDPLVTHNTAILGILGSGKTFLALELTQRMMAYGIKVISLDITGEYPEKLGYRGQKTMVTQLKQIGAGGRTNVQLNVEDGGSINAFREAVAKYIGVFLADSCKEHLLIVDPGEFEVWRQDSRPYQGNASMARLTPTEITRIVTEETMECLRVKGVTDRARACIVFEEAHSLVPEWNSVAAEGDKTATNGTAKAILQGRKYGLGCLLITQRTANVTKSILNQCNTIFAMRTYDATGVEFLRNYIGDDFAGVLSTLENRHAIVFGRASSCSDPVLVRLNDREDFLRVFQP